LNLGSRFGLATARDWVETLRGMRGMNEHAVAKLAVFVLEIQ